MITEDELSSILDKALEEVISKQGKVNLAEIGRITGVTRQRLRSWQENSYKLPAVQPRSPKKSKLDPFKELINSKLKEGVSNSSVITDILRKLGYKGGQTIVYDYIQKHKDLIPCRRTLAVAPQESRGQRYETEAGDCYQMDWGFVHVEDEFGTVWKAACFAMVCHHCGFRYVEFFPNSRQENLFIGMIHAFMYMGIPKRVLTDNMKSVTTGRDAMHKPIMHPDYNAFQKSLGFTTELCKVAHPFTKGAVERLVRYVKENFIVGQRFVNVTDLNRKALRWCIEKNAEQMRYRDFITVDKHHTEPLRHFTEADRTRLMVWLAPIRSIGFDGYVNYEGRRFGVPYSFEGKHVRVTRKGEKLYVLEPQTFEVLSSFDVDWSRADKTCKGQWAELSDDYGDQPMEQPSAPVKAALKMSSRPLAGRFDRFRIPARADENDKEVR